MSNVYYTDYTHMNMYIFCVWPCLLKYEPKRTPSEFEYICKKMGKSEKEGNIGSECDNV